MIKKISCQIICFFLLFFSLPLISKASNVEIVGMTSIIDIQKNRTANITEMFDIYFIDDVNEFERNIDKKLTIYEKNGDKKTTTTVIENISSMTLINHSQNQKVETAYLKLNGVKDTIEKASLSYQYNLGQDTARKYDEFFYNIVSNFDSVTSNVSFQIVLPEHTSFHKIDFAINGKYNLTEEDVSYIVEGSTIKGQLNLMLEKQDTFSVRLEFPNHYFTNTTNTFQKINYFFLVFPSITLIVIIVFFMKYRYKKQVIRERQLFPPYQFDPVEITYLYKGTVSELDFGTLIIFLANKGYLMIQENDDGYKLGKANSFKFLKIKEYNLRNASQKLLFDGLFKERKTAELKEIEFTVGDRIKELKEIVDTSDNKIKMFYTDIKKKKKISWLFIIVSVISLQIIPIREMALSYLYVPVISIGILFALALMFLFNIKGVVKIIIGTLLLGVMLYFNLQGLIDQQNLLIIYVIGMIISIVSAVLCHQFPLRTKFGDEKYQTVNSFRNTLKNMTKVELNQLITENKNYFYEMVPYAYVLGILSTWMNKGKDIINEKPTWHMTKEEFSISKQELFINHVIFTTTQVLIKGIHAKKGLNPLPFKTNKLNDD